MRSTSSSPPTGVPSAHVRASGMAEVLQEPVDQFYGVRDCAFRDPAGNMLRFNATLPNGT